MVGISLGLAAQIFKILENQILRKNLIRMHQILVFCIYSSSENSVPVEGKKQDRNFTSRLFFYKKKYMFSEKKIKKKAHTSSFEAHLRAKTKKIRRKKSVTKSLISS